MPGPILGTVDTMDEQAISQNRLEDAEITNSTTVDFFPLAHRGSSWQLPKEVSFME